jgi:hypothetical protein
VADDLAERHVSQVPSTRWRSLGAGLWRWKYTDSRRSASVTSADVADPYDQVTFATAPERRAWNRHDVRLLEHRFGQRR